MTATALKLPASARHLLFVTLVLAAARDASAVRYVINPPVAHVKAGSSVTFTIVGEGGTGSPSLPQNCFIQWTASSAPGAPLQKASGTSATFSAPVRGHYSVGWGVAMPDPEGRTDDNGNIIIVACNAPDIDSNSVRDAGIWAYDPPTLISFKPWSPPAAGSAVNWNVQTQPCTLNSAGGVNGCEPTAYQYVFGDSRDTCPDFDSGTQAPHTYYCPGTYTVKLTVSNPAGSDSKTDTIEVTETQPPIAQFDVTVPTSQLIAGQPIKLRNLSLYGRSYLWDFGDGTTSTEMSPTHVFPASDDFVVKLTVTNNLGSASTTTTMFMFPATPTGGQQPPSTASFTWSPAKPVIGQNTQFTDTSSSNVVRWRWNFADGTPQVLEKNPAHAFATWGQKNVELWVSNLYGRKGVVLFVQVLSNTAPPLADFTFTPFNVKVNQPVKFTDTSAGATAWHWDFGDGATSNQQHPTHTYTTAGQKEVKLRVTNAFGSDSTSKFFPCHEDTPEDLAANFDWAPATPTVGQAVQFTDRSTGGPEKWSWVAANQSLTFTSTERNPIFTFPQAGSWIVNLRIDKGSETKQLIKSVTVNGTEKPVASFSFSPGSPSPGQPVSFFNTSLNAPTSYLWSFGDGATSTFTHPSHTFSEEKSYTVSLTATNSAGSDTTTRTVTVTSGESIPEARFTASPNPTVTNRVVSFTDASTGKPSEWLWEFGDGRTSTAQHPQHSFGAEGNYLVRLTVKNSKGTGSATNPIQVTKAQQKPEPDFIVSPATPAINQTVTFTDTSKNDPTQWQWSFGDGSSAFGKTATHVYTASGSYSVKLVAANDAGSAEVTKPVVVITAPIQAEFNISGQLNQDAPVTFTSTSTGNPDLIHWLFSDGLGFFGQSVTRTFPTGGVYSVQLTVYRSSDGATSLRERGFTILGKPVASFKTSGTAFVGRPVQFIDTSTGPPVAWLWIAGDGSGSPQSTFTHTFAAVGSMPVTLTVSNAAGSDTVTRFIRVEQLPAAERPAITRLAGNYGPCLFKGLPFAVNYRADVLWRSLQPGTVSVTLNGGSMTTAPAGASGASFTLDTSQLTVGSNLLTARARAATGEESDAAVQHAFAFGVALAPQSKMGFDASRASLTTAYGFPPKAIEAITEVPSAVPIFGGYPIGFKDIQAKLEEVIRTDCTYAGTVSGGGAATGAGATVGVKASGTINRLVSKESGVSKSLTAAIGIEGSLAFATKPTPIVEFMPAMKAPCKLRFVSSVCGILKVTAQVSGAVGGQLNFTMKDDGSVVYAGTTLSQKIGAEVKATAEVKPAKVDVFGGGDVTFTGSFTPPHFRELKSAVEVGAKISVYSFEAEGKLTAECTVTPGGGANCGGLDAADGSLRVRPAPSINRATAVEAAGADDLVLQNVSSMASPVAAGEGTPFLAFLSENPAASGPQRLDVRVISRDGASWSAPVAVTNDSIGDFNPTAAANGAGKAVIVWERLKDGSLTNADVSDLSQLPVLMAQVEIAASTRQPNGEWSPAEVLTANAEYDHSPVVAVMDDGVTHLAWIRESPDGSSKQQVVARRHDATGWRSEQVIASDLSGIDVLSISAHGSDAAIVFTHDEDGSSDTSQDREVGAITYGAGAWSERRDLTNDSVGDSSASVVFDAEGRAEAVWLADQTLVARHVTDGTTAVVRPAGGEGAVANPLATRHPNGDLLVTWLDRGDVFGRIRENGSTQWSGDIRLTESPGQEGNISIDAGEGRVRVIALRAPADASIAPARYDLAEIVVPLHVDLAAVPGSMVAETLAPAAGERTRLVASLRNEGARQVRDVRIALFHGRTVTGSAVAESVVPGVWSPGESRTVEFEIAYDAATPLFTIAVDPASEMNDANRANNAISWSFSNHAPTACIQADRVEGGAPLTVNFTSCSRDADGALASIAWSFPDGSSSGSQTTSHTFEQDGTYEVLIAATDDMGGVGTASVTVTVGSTVDRRVPAGEASLFIPVVARTAGVAGSFFSSDLSLLNTDAVRDLTVDAVYLPDGRTDTFRRAITLRGGEMLDVNDVVAELFGARDGGGSVRLDLSHAHAVALTRLYDDKTTGTAGFSNPGMSAPEAIGEGVTGVILQHWLPGYRTNVGFTEIGGVASLVTVTAYDEAGNERGSKVFGVQPYGRSQINGDPLFQSRGRLDIEVTGGRVFAYASTIDSSSNDPIIQMPDILRDSPGDTSLLVPIVGHLRGLNNTTWRSDVRVLNPGQAEAEVTLELRTASATHSRVITLGAGEMAAWEDVTVALFPEITGDVLGALAIQSSAPIVATSRTFNLTSKGTYGLYIPARDRSQMLTLGETAWLVGLRENAEYRTNVGFASLDEPSEVDVRAFDANGTFIGERRYGIPAGQNVQIGALLRNLGATGPIDAAWIEITVTGGSVLAYATVNDNQTGDGTYVEARR